MMKYRTHTSLVFRIPCLGCFIISLVTFVLFLPAIPLVHAATFVIDCDKTANLIDAINAANATSTADTIALTGRCTYILNAPDNFTDGPNGLPSITSPITIEGNGAIVQRSDVSGTPDFRIFHVANRGNLLINDLTISNGNDASSNNGGGILTKAGSSLVLNRSTITDNHSTFLGGGIANDGHLVLDNDSNVINNSAVDGGGVFNGRHGMLEVRNSTFRGNSATFGGGMFADNGATTHILTGSQIVENDAMNWGGGIASAGFGSGADLGTTLVVNHGTISNNRANEGGGIFVNIGTATVVDSLLENNQARLSGGGIWNSTMLNLDNSTVHSNIAGNDERWNAGGGILNNGGAVELIDTVIHDNQADDNGGGISTDHGPVKLTRSVISNNHVTVHSAGGIYCNNANLVLIDSRIENNQAPTAGGILYGGDKHLTIKGSTITNNRTRGYGGGIQVGWKGYSYPGTVSISDSEIVGNLAGLDGGGIFFAGGAVGKMTVVDSNVDSNHSGTMGGGIWSNGELALSGGTVRNNTADASGGGIGIEDDASIFITDARIYGNVSSQIRSGGGGGLAVYNGASAHISGTQIYANTAAAPGRGSGGGIQLDNGSHLMLIGSWVVANAAPNNDGGGIYVGGGSAYIENSIIAGNTMDMPSDAGGGLLFCDGNFRIVNSHIIGNHAAGKGAAIATCTPPDLMEVTNTLIVSNIGITGIDDKYGSGAIFQLNYCDTYGNSPDGAVGVTINRTSCLGTTAEDGTNPLLAGGALPSGVGPAFAAEWLNYDYRLSANSPAVNAGTPLGAPVIDIKGDPRDTAPDIGAYELIAPNLVPIKNADFEAGTEPWKFWTDGKGTFTTESPGYTGDYAARIDIVEPGDNVQLYQKGFLLEPKTYYRLEFSARSNTGHDVAVYVHKHQDPYTYYGLRNFRVNLTEEWQTFGVTFRTKNFDAPTTDSRLRLWLKPFNAADDIYWFDSISLTKVTTPVVRAANQASLSTGDINGNVQSTGDTASAMVMLVDIETEGLTYTSMVRTDATGIYHFSDVPYGTYELRVEGPIGYLTPEPVQLAVSEIPNESIDFSLDAVTTTVYMPLISR